jgi:hypothetical protein
VNENWTDNFVRPALGAGAIAKLLLMFLLGVLPNGLRLRSVVLARAWTLLGSRKNLKPRVRELLDAKRVAESPFITVRVVTSH